MQHQPSSEDLEVSDIASHIALILTQNRYALIR